MDISSSAVSVFLLCVYVCTNNTCVCVFVCVRDVCVHIVLCVHLHMCIFCVNAWMRVSACGCVRVYACRHVHIWQVCNHSSIIILLETCLETGSICLFIWLYVRLVASELLLKFYYLHLPGTHGRRLGITLFEFLYEFWRFKLRLNKLWISEITAIHWKETLCLRVVFVYGYKHANLWCGIPFCILWIYLLPLIKEAVLICARAE